MKGRFQIPIYAGENSIFSDGVAAQMVGQMTKDGDVIMEARREGNQTIWLIVEKELPSDFPEIQDFSLDQARKEGMTLKEFIALTTDIVERKGRNSMEDLHVYLANGSEVQGVAFVERVGSNCPQIPAVMVY